MSTIVCQNLVTCFESPETTTTTTTLKLKVAAAQSPSAVDFFRKNSATEDHPPPQFSNWGFLPIKEYNNDKSFSRLSEKSLQLCTENLGSETGTDIITDDSTIFCAPSPRGHKQKPPENHHRRERRSFPPPLTTMSGSSSLQVRRHREEGRLIIEAVEAPFRNSYLTAERSEGRLRLCFLEPAETATITSCGGDGEDEVGECGGETAAEEEMDQAVTELKSEKEEVKDNGEMNLEMEMEKYQRLSRCKESGHGSKGLCSSWKPALWVATS